MVNWRKLCLQSMLISFGEVPHPGASVRALEASVKSALVKASGGYEIDPEVPDNLMAVLLPALKMRGLDQAQIVEFITGMNYLGVATGGGSGFTDPGVLTPPQDKSGFASGDESLIDNLLDIGGNLLTGNIGGTISSVADGFFDLIFGGGII